MLDIKNNVGNGKLEIDLVVRDANGKPTGKRKRFATNDGGKLWEFWLKHQGKPKRKKRSKKRRKKEQKNLPSGPEAEKILKRLYKDTGSN